MIRFPLFAPLPFHSTQISLASPLLKMFSSTRSIHCQLNSITNTPHNFCSCWFIHIKCCLPAPAWKIHVLLLMLLLTFRVQLLTSPASLPGPQPPSIDSILTTTHCDMICWYMLIYSYEEIISPINIAWIKFRGRYQADDVPWRKGNGGDKTKKHIWPAYTIALSHV